jgi:hypothetical protein
VLRAFKLAGPDAQRAPGALVHALRHTYATELANPNASVYTLMKLLGHESMATSQRYVISAGIETRTAAAQNPLYNSPPIPISSGAPRFIDIEYGRSSTLAARPTHRWLRVPLILRIAFSDL